MELTQLSTFKVQNKLYGIDVKLVQEITKALPTTAVPLAPNYIHGLINLRGQIATALGVQELFELKNEASLEEKINVVCKCDGLLLSLLVDEIGDVVEVNESIFENTPETVSPRVRQFMLGVYKTSDDLLSVIDIKKIVEFLNK